MKKAKPKDLSHRLRIIKRWMYRQYKRGQNCEKTNAVYITLLKEKLTK